MGQTCLRCRPKFCENTESGTIEICDYGVAFYNNNGQILKKEERLTLQHISQNLRHELNKILQTIISEAIKIDPSVSTKKIEPEKPASRIVGAVVIIDQFIEMITGVNDFSPSEKYAENLDKQVSLYSIIDRSSKIYSLVSNIRRAKRLSIEISCSKKMRIGFGAKIIEYIISILCDNVWKYSIDDGVAQVIAKKNDYGDVNLSFINISKSICATQNIFNRGYQGDDQFEGFGYGLYWATILIDYYNELSGRGDDKLELKHYQIKTNNTFEQHFILENIRT